jgi:periplasmic protein TonB
VTPDYPAEAEDRGVQGTVAFRVIIGKDGSVKGLKKISGRKVLAEAAETAIRQWIYEPTLFRGKPIEAEATIVAKFALPRRARAMPAPRKKPPRLKPPHRPIYRS